MHVCIYTHPYIHIYFTACGPPQTSTRYVWEAEPGVQKYLFSFIVESYMHMVINILNNTTPYGKIMASHEGSLHSSTLKGNNYSYIMSLI